MLALPCNTLPRENSKPQSMSSISARFPVKFVRSSFSVTAEKWIELFKSQFIILANTLASSSLHLEATQILRFIGTASQTLRCFFKSTHFHATRAEYYELSFTFSANHRIFPQRACAFFYESQHFPDVSYTRKCDSALSHCFLNPQAFVRIVALGCTCISSFLATHGRYALVPLRLGVGRSGNLLSQFAEPTCGVLSFSPEAASSPRSSRPFVGRCPILPTLL